MSKWPMRRFPLALLLCTFNFAHSAATQTPASETSDVPFTLSVGVRLVEIPVFVRAAGGGGTVDNLRQSSFEIFEDNVAQEITLFKHEDTPLSIGLVLNTGNLPGRRERISDAAMSFIRESNPGNKTFLVDFSIGFRNPQFQRGIADLIETLVDAPGRTVPGPRSGPAVRKAVLVIASVDGDNSGLTSSGISLLMKYIRESNDVMFYAVGLQAENGKPASKIVRSEFTQIAEASGGEAYFPKSVGELPDICKRIAHDLRNQYTLGFSPKNMKADGGWRSIRVSVISPPAEPKPIVRARQGYIAPMQ